MSSKDQSRESPFQMAARVANATSSDGYWEAYRKGMMAPNLNEMRFPPRRDMTWQTGFSGQAAMRNQFPTNDEYMKHLANGMRAMSQNEMLCRHMAQMAAAQNAIAKDPSPMPFAAKAAYLSRTASTPKERRVADLAVFVAKYRERKHGDVIAFPAWLSEGGRKRLLDIANRH